MAAATLGRVAVRDIDTGNGGTAFGFAGDTLASFTDAEPGVATFKWTPREPTSRLAFNGDLAVRVLGEHRLLRRSRPPRRASRVRPGRGPGGRSASVAG